MSMTQTRYRRRDDPATEGAHVTGDLEESFESCDLEPQDKALKKTLRALMDSFRISEPPVVKWKAGDYWQLENDGYSLSEATLMYQIIWLAERAREANNTTLFSMAKRETDAVAAKVSTRLAKMKKIAAEYVDDADTADCEVIFHYQLHESRQEVRLSVEKSRYNLRIDVPLTDRESITREREEAI